MKLITSIELWKADRSAKITTPEPLLDVCASDPKIQSKLGSIETVRLELYAGAKISTASTDKNYYLSQRKILKLNYDDNTFKEYRITRGARSFSGKNNRQIQATFIAQDLQEITVRKTLSNGVVRASVTFYDETFESIVSNLLSTAYNCPSYFSIGTLPARLKTETYNMNLNASYLLAALKKLCEHAKAEYKVVYNSGSYKVNFYDTGKLGGGKPATRTIDVQGDNQNRIELKQSTETDKYFSRIIGIMGQQNQTQTMAGAVWDIASVSLSGGDTDITLNDDVIAKDGYGLINGKTVYFGVEGDYYEILSTAEPNKITVSGDATALTKGTFKVGTGKDDVVFLEDSDAIAEIGIREEKYTRTDITAYANLADDAGIATVLSKWSSGKPVGWNSYKGGVISKSSSDLFVRYGKYAAKVTANKDEGIKTIGIDLQPAKLLPYFSTKVYFQVDAGSVRIELIDSQGNIYPEGAVAETDSRETLSLSIGGEQPTAGLAKVRIIAQEDNTIFYVDAITVTRSASAQPYSPLMGPRALWLESGKYLKRYGGASPQKYSCSCMESGNDPEITIGSWVKVKEDWDGSTFKTEKTLRVIELSYSENRLTGRSKKNLTLASQYSDSSRFFQENFVSKNSQQAAVAVPDGSNKLLYTRDKDDEIDQKFGDVFTKTEADLRYLQISKELQEISNISGTKNFLNSITGTLGTFSTGVVGPIIQATDY